jgi:hypothetical protein
MPHRLALERADEETHIPQHRTIFRPLADDFRFQRVLARIEVGPQLRDGLRHIGRSSDSRWRAARKDGDGECRDTVGLAKVRL